MKSQDRFYATSNIHSVMENDLIQEIVSYYNIEKEISEERKLSGLK